MGAIEEKTMSRDTFITPRDKKIMKLSKQVQAVIKTRKEWNEFKEYMKVYYPNCINCFDKGNYTQIRGGVGYIIKCKECKYNDYISIKKEYV